MFVRRTATQPPFLFAYTDWHLDGDVSQHMHEYGNVEGGITQVCWRLLGSWDDEELSTQCRHGRLQVP